jgi:hypothetical protein
VPALLLLAVCQRRRGGLALRLGPLTLPAGAVLVALLVVFFCVLVCGVRPAFTDLVRLGAAEARVERRSQR